MPSFPRDRKLCTPEFLYVVHILPIGPFIQLPVSDSTLSCLAGRIAICSAWDFSGSICMGYSFGMLDVVDSTILYGPYGLSRAKVTFEPQVPLALPPTILAERAEMMR